MQFWVYILKPQKVFTLKYYEKALESFDRAERFMPDSYEIHKGRTFVYLEQKREDLANQELRQIFNTTKIENIFQMCL